MSNCLGCNLTLTNATEDEPALLCDSCSTSDSPGMISKQFNHMFKLFSQMNMRLNRVADDIKKDLPEIVSKEVTDQLETKMLSVNNELSDMKTKLNSFTKAQSCECSEKLEITNKRLDILVSGCPTIEMDIFDFAVNLCSHLNVNIRAEDFSKVFRLSSDSKIVLIKFLSVATRDRVMKNYFALSPPLTLDKICPELGIESRLFLNDNLTKKMYNVRKICVDLMKNGQIKSFSSGLKFFKIINHDGSNKLIYSESDIPNYNSLVDKIESKSSASNHGLEKSLSRNDVIFIDESIDQKAKPNAKPKPSKSSSNQKPAPGVGVNNVKRTTRRLI